jgi:Putative metallopeptidase
MADVLSSHAGARLAGFALLSALLAVLLAAGCGGSGSSSSTESAEDSSSGTGEVRVVWQEPASEEDAAGYELLKAGQTKGVATALAEAFELPHPLLVRGVNGIGGGPFYNPEDNSITLPYGFAALVLNVESGSNPEISPEELGEQAGAVDNFILAHEFAHALIANFELPVLGGEEDAADSIATVVTLGVPEGAAYAADASAFWADFSSRQEPPALSEYADVHSLDLQRAFNVLCWVAGSSRQSFEEVAELGALPESRLESCPQEYEQLAASIEKELKPHLQNEVSLAPAQ